VFACAIGNMVAVGGIRGLLAVEQKVTVRSPAGAA
jgi:hypothetical protein